MFFQNSILKSSSFDLYFIINLKKRVLTTNEIINKNERFFDNDILLLLYLYRLKINNILFFSILKTISYLFIYNFSRIKSYYFNLTIKIKYNFFFQLCTFNVSNK